MKPLIDKLEYQRLELIIPAKANHPVEQLISRLLKFVGLFLKQRLWQSQEVQVWCTYDRQGNQWWSAYDRASGHSVNLLSEDEMRRWLEQRYSGSH
ncbi:MAG TPA: hypothetical protein V6D06_16725 [Trichocoleus sp.]